MDKMELKKSILQSLCREFNENGMPAAIYQQNVAGFSEDVLRVQYSDDPDENYGGVAEYTFLDTAFSAKDILYFSGYVVLRTGISKDRMPTVIKAAARMNFALPYGSVLVNETVGFAAFRLDTRIPMALDMKSIEMCANTNCAHLVELTRQFCGSLVDLIDGVLSYDEYVQVIEQ